MGKRRTSPPFPSFLRSRESSFGLVFSRALSFLPLGERGRERSDYDVMEMGKVVAGFSLYFCTYIVTQS